MASPEQVQQRLQQLLSQSQVSLDPNQVRSMAQQIAALPADQQEAQIQFYARAWSIAQQPLPSPIPANQQGVGQGETVPAGPASGTETVTGDTPPSAQINTSTAGGRWLGSRTLEDLPDAGLNLGSQADELAALMGMSTQQLQQEYTAYVAHASQPSEQMTQGGVRQQTAGQAMSMSQWVGDQLTNVLGVNARYEPLLNAMRLNWEEAYGTPMPPQLQQQMLAQIQKMPSSDRSQLDGALEGWVTSYSQAMNQSDPGQRQQILNQGLTTLMHDYSMAPLAQSVTNYAAANAGTVNLSTQLAQDQQARQQNYIQWLSGHGITPTPEMLAQLMKLPSAESVTNPASGTDYAYLLNLPSNVPGLSWGQHDQAYSTLSPLWTQYFGIGRKPSSQELLWSVGKSQDEIMNHVMNSPSNVPGVTVGRYQDLSSFLGDMQKQLPVHQYDDFVQELDGHLKAPAGAKP